MKPRPYALPLLISLGVHGVLIGAAFLLCPSVPTARPFEYRVVLNFVPPSPIVPRRVPSLAPPRIAPSAPRTKTPPRPAVGQVPPTEPRRAVPELRPQAPRVPAPEESSVAPDVPASAPGGAPEAAPPGGTEVPVAGTPGGSGAEVGSHGEAGGIVDVQGLQVLRSVKPVYPADCRRRGEEGTAVLLLDVRGGSVREVRVERSSGYRGLDGAAAAALRKWRFNTSLEATVRVPVVFRLE